MGTNAANTRTATYLADLVEESKGRPRFISFSTRLAGVVQGRGAEKKRRGDHVMEYVLLTGASYMSMVTRSITTLETAMQSSTFVGDIVDELATKNIRCEQTGAAITKTDVIDALTGTVYGRKGILTALKETEAGVNVSTSEHVYEPLEVDGEFVPGCKVYTEPGSADPKAPVPGTIYLAGIIIASRVVEASPNGSKLPSKRGAVATAKDYIESKLDLPIRRYRTFRLLPGEVLSLKSGVVSFHAEENGAVRPGVVPIEKLMQGTK